MFQPIHEPPESDDDQHTHQNYRVVVHQICRNRHCVREAEHDVEKYNQNAAKSIDHIAIFAHPKVTSGGVFAAAEQVWEDREEIAECAEHDEGADEIVESCAGS